MTQTQKKNYYQILKVTENAKSYVIEAAYNALIKDIEVSNLDIESRDKIKNVLNVSYAILSDPTKREAYDKKLKNIDKIEVKEQPILEKNTSNIEQTENLKIQKEHSDRQIRNSENISIKSTTAVENKKPSKLKHMKYILISLGVLVFSFTSYIGYKLYPNNIQEKPNKIVHLIS